MDDKSGSDGGLRELALFAGAGGGILGGKLLGWRTVCAVEWEPYAASVLAARQNDGVLPAFPIWDDVRTFDGKPWRGIVDVVSGGFPCQDISAAGTGDGLDGERSGLWREMARIVGEVRPQFVFVENSPFLVGRGLVRVLADLASLGFDAQWGVVGAGDIGAPHERERLWIVAYADPELGKEGRRGFGQQGERAVCGGDCGSLPQFDRRVWMEMAVQHARDDDGLAPRVERTQAIGNGQVPLVAATAWRILTHNAKVS
jgi:DNA (cytosine-5)-methyltransferase 1